MGIPVNNFASGSKLPSKRPQTTTNGTPSKKPKIVEFDSEDEKEAIASNKNGKDKQIRNSEKLARKQESVRLKASRMKLPIWDGQEALLAALAENDSIVVLGETGSGKTTQLPQFILSTPGLPRIAVTQPRRVAAMTLATRVAAETGYLVGELVGFRVRFADETSSKTRLTYMTDGTLLAEMLGDKNLDHYDVIVLDEAHERSLRTDMLLGFLKGIQARRKEIVRQWKAENPGRIKKDGEAPFPTELKVVVMSATINAQRFSEFFNKAPILYVSGRQFPVTIYYSQAPQDNYIEAALSTIFEIHLKHPPGDILVFLPGQEDIDSLQMSITSFLPDLRKSYPKKAAIQICPLYAKLPPQEQAKAFAPALPNTRKIILSTNVAETSVTIPGVKYVVDTGLCKEKMHHAAVGIDSLVIEGISQSSARQRTGRAGRESAGVCYRLYTEKHFSELALEPTPEIQRVSMTFALLHLIATGQCDVFKFDFMDRPSQDSMKAALASLIGLGAIDEKRQITTVGSNMSRLPLEPHHARVLLASFEEGCAKEIIDLVSLLGHRDSLLVNSLATREAAEQARKKFIHRSGDHLTTLNILRSYEDVEKSERRAWCKDHYINAKAMLAVLDSRKQLIERCKMLKLDPEITSNDDSDLILGACVAGLFGNTALLQPDSTYRHTLTQQIVAIHPGSSLSNLKRPAIMYDELVFTSKTFARGVSEIQLNTLRSKAKIFNF